MQNIAHSQSLLSAAPADSSSSSWSGFFCCPIKSREPRDMLNDRGSSFEAESEASEPKGKSISSKAKAGRKIF